VEVIMAEEMELEPQCDVDDLLCQMRVLGNLEGLANLLGTERFQQQYPDYASLLDVTKERIDLQKSTLRSTMERCNLPIPEELQEQVEENPDVEQTTG
jgi:hypothetical protein